MRIIAAFFIIMLVAVSSIFAFETIDGQDVRSLDGEIVDLDTETNQFTVRWLQDEIQVIYDQKTFKVDEKTRIEKGTDKIRIDDLNSGDNITVKYFERGYDLPLAVSVYVQI